MSAYSIGGSEMNVKNQYIIFQQFDCQGYIIDPEVKWHVDTNRHIQNNHIEDACVIYDAATAYSLTAIHCGASIGRSAQCLASSYGTIFFHSNLNSNPTTEKNRNIVSFVLCEIEYNMYTCIHRKVRMIDMQRQCINKVYYTTYPILKLIT